jgi:excinuclease UvrABC ATPase subunit
VGTVTEIYDYLRVLFARIGVPHCPNCGRVIAAQTVRPAGTLSGGEGQRIRLATQIGSSLVGVLYILDEPSIGLQRQAR